MAAKDIVEAFEKEYYPMEFFSNLQCSHHFAKGWCAAKAAEIQKLSHNMESLISEYEVMREGNSIFDLAKELYTKEKKIYEHLETINERLQKIESTIDPIKMNISTYQDAETRRDKVLTRLSAIEKDVQYLMTKDEMKGK